MALRQGRVKTYWYIEIRLIGLEEEDAWSWIYDQNGSVKNALGSEKLAREEMQRLIDIDGDVSEYRIIKRMIIDEILQ